MTDLPSGTVTFLFTDLEGSTRLWEEHPDAMHDALARHDELVRKAIESHAGHVVKKTGDGFHAAFATARDAVARRGRRRNSRSTAEPWAQYRTVTCPHGSPYRRGSSTEPATTTAPAEPSGADHERRARRPDRDVARHRGAGPRRAGRPLRARLPSASTGSATWAVPKPCSSSPTPTSGATSGRLRSLDAYPGKPAAPGELVRRSGRRHGVGDPCARRGAHRHPHRGRRRREDAARVCRVAGEVLPKFPDGAWVAELATAPADPEGLVQVGRRGRRRSTASLDATRNPCHRPVARQAAPPAFSTTASTSCDAATRLAAAILRECPNRFG